MARPTWDSEIVNAEIYRQLLQELRYEVSDPADLELDPSVAFLTMATGDADFWVSSWMPAHQVWLDADMPDGSRVGDSVSVIGEQMMAGGLQGYLVTKSVAEEYGIATLDQVSEDPEINGLFDQDGDGKADIYGCPKMWKCDNIITEQICQFDWNISQLQGDYDAMFAEATTKVNDGQPAIIYTWTPTAYITQLVPGGNVMWLSVENRVTDENCAQQEGGEGYAQPYAVVSMDERQCLLNSKGECNLGWTGADVQAAANNDFLDNNPAAEKLIESVRIPVMDAALLNVAYAGTDGSTAEVAAIAAKWIEDNRDTVDRWLESARNAA